MAGSPSALGFGHQPFGHPQFGWSDWAEEVTWRIIPAFYRDDDGVLEHDPPEPLRKFIDSIKPPIQEIKDTWDIFIDLWDANRIRIDQLNYLAANFGITPREGKAETLRRSEVLNTVTLNLQKGLDNGYVIAGAFEGLLVTISSLWAADGTPGAALGTEGPTEFTPNFAGFPADEIPADAVFDDIYAKWPRPLAYKDFRRTHYLDLFFYKPDDTEIEDFLGVSQGVVDVVERVRPIHVVIRSLRFDGPRAVGGGWSVGPVVAENAAVGGGWSVPVVGARHAVGGGWAVPVVATTTP